MKPQTAKEEDTHGIFAALYFFFARNSATLLGSTKDLREAQIKVKEVRLAAIPQRDLLGKTFLTAQLYVVGHGPLSKVGKLAQYRALTTESGWVGKKEKGLNNIWKHPSLRVQAMSTTQGNVTTSKGIAKFKNEPDHLLVLVHGILASFDLCHRTASSSNTYTKTFGGIDGAGNRLADEVLEIVQKTESLKRISFLAHSLGGLFARYAIAVLYSPSALIKGRPDDLNDSRNANSEYSTCSSKRGTIAGLEPINFVTLATPHLGVKGRRQFSLAYVLAFYGEYTVSSEIIIIVFEAKIVEIQGVELREGFALKITERNKQKMRCSLWVPEEAILWLSKTISEFIDSSGYCFRKFRGRRCSLIGEKRSNERGEFLAFQSFSEREPEAGFSFRKGIDPVGGVPFCQRWGRAFLLANHVL
ncbi:hypothetical protein HHK36_003588 [Tetracentron sinense]|uniref:DUF676 domain-containing protein n=1 Tax=Tetracentron sinense TaxID=13715 RepID=A0A835DSB1_TETSI|nr:hypothetical protein HHK36_003588 [Tetracentron sinense]